MESTIGEALIRAVNVLRQNKIENARLDAEVLLSHVLKLSRINLIVNSRDIISQKKLDEFNLLIKRRASKEPVAYIVGEKEFMSLTFIVNKNVLVPRPETEQIIEEALAIKPQRIIDVGTGSGAIAVSLAYYLPNSQVIAVDISEKALQVAQKNAEKQNVAQRIRFIEGNLLDSLDVADNYERFDLITANLPYIPISEIENLPDDVRLYEPVLALEGGDNGLKLYYNLYPAAKRLLRYGGLLLLEIGYDQAEELCVFLEREKAFKTEVLKDLAGLDRVVKAVKY